MFSVEACDQDITMFRQKLVTRLWQCLGRSLCPGYGNVQVEKCDQVMAKFSNVQVEACDQVITIFRQKHLTRLQQYLGRQKHVTRLLQCLIRSMRPGYDNVQIEACDQVMAILRQVEAYDRVMEMLMQKQVEVNDQIMAIFRQKHVARLWQCLGRSM